MDAHESLLRLEQNVLTVQEVVAFRIAVYRAVRREFPMPYHPPTSSHEGRPSHGRHSGHDGGASIDSDELETVGSGLPVALSGESILSLEHRLRMLNEFFHAMDQEALLEVNESRSDRQPGQLTNRRYLPSQMVWLASLKCMEFSLLVTDRHPRWLLKSTGSDVARLSCAIAVQHQLTGDGSWEFDTRVGSLKVQDCTASQESTRDRTNAPFPDLVCNKPTLDEKTMELDGKHLYESVNVAVKRCSTTTRELGRVTTTTVRVRVLPLEIVYATAPFEALSRILTVADVELIDDYRDLSSRLYEWRERQRVRLVRALAHKKKRIVLDVDVGAPVILIPEECYENSPLLVVDLGRILFFNDQRRTSQVTSSFDDKWRLELKDLQVQYSSTFRFRQIPIHGSPPLTRPDLQQLVEPFSLEFMVSTRFESQGAGGSARKTDVRIHATLPRLALNFTASAVRLVLRLQSQWEKRSFKHRPRLLSAERLHRLQAASSPTHSERQIEFLFSAPVLQCRFENDVDGRDCRVEDGSPGWSTTPLLELALKGIDGRILSMRSADGSTRLSCEARLRALYSIDLFQKAGGDFLYLLSSVCPDLMIGNSPRDIISHDSSNLNDLVRFSYETHGGRRPVDAIGESSPASGREHRASKVSVNFNELYVEWNPGA
jgi:Repeating coiled region of VPS13